MPAIKKPRKRNMQDVPLSWYQSIERRVDKLEAAVKALKAKKPAPRDPKDDAYWRKSKVQGPGSRVQGSGARWNIRNRG